MRKPKPLSASEITLLARSIQQAGLAHANLKLVFPVGTEVAFMHEGKCVDATVVNVGILEGMPSVITSASTTPIHAARIIKI